MASPSSLLDAAAAEGNVFLGQGPELEQQRREVLAGLRAEPKSIHCKYLYDERGSQIFDRICELEEYYPTRTELAIMEEHGAAMAEHLGPRVLLVEFGAGSTVKVRHLLDHLEDPVAFAPVDISHDHLVKAASRLAVEYPTLEVLPVSADYTEDFELPQHEEGRTVVYFPGSTVGNFSPTERHDLLDRIATIAGPGGGLLIGVDLRKSRAVLEAAYDDAEGVTAEFNYNLLRRFNRELDADFDRDAFDYEALWNPDDGRVEMYLVSRRAQTVTIDEERIELAAGERILTEHSYKFRVEDFAADAALSGFRLVEVWTDPSQLFSVQYYALDDPTRPGSP
ncbi:MAG: L-histidine N(alpha)-methyltransferase [Acidobacteriota bacterium]